MDAETTANASFSQSNSELLKATVNCLSALVIRCSEEYDYGHIVYRNEK